MSDNQFLFDRKPTGKSYRTLRDSQENPQSASPQAGQQPPASREQAMREHFAKLGSIALPLRSERKLPPLEEIEFPESPAAGQTSAQTQRFHDQQNSTRPLNPIALAFSDNPSTAQLNGLNGDTPTLTPQQPLAEKTAQQPNSQRKHSFSDLPHSKEDAAESNTEAGLPERKVVLQAKADTEISRNSLPEIEKPPVDRSFLLIEPRDSNSDRTSSSSPTDSHPTEKAVDNLCHLQNTEDGSPRSSTSRFPNDSCSDNHGSQILRWHFANCLANCGGVLPRSSLPMIEGLKSHIRPASLAEESLMTSRRTKPKPIESDSANDMNPEISHLATAEIQVDASLLQRSMNLQSNTEPSPSRQNELSTTKFDKEDHSKVAFNATSSSDANHLPIQPSPSNTQFSPTPSPSKSDFIPQRKASESSEASRISANWQVPHSSLNSSNSNDFDLQPVRNAVADDSQRPQFALAGVWVLPVEPHPANPTFDHSTSVPPVNPIPSPTEHPSFVEKNAINGIAQSAAFAETETASNALRLRNPEFCSEIRGFGQITPVANRRFRSGQRTLVYCEVENYRSDQQTSAQHGTIFVTRFSGNYRLENRWGEIVQSGNLPEIEDRSQRRRRDFYIYFPITFSDLPEGDYALKIEIEELSDALPASGRRQKAVLADGLSFSIDR